MRAAVGSSLAHATNVLQQHEYRLAAISGYDLSDGLEEAGNGMMDVISQVHDSCMLANDKVWFLILEVQCYHVECLSRALVAS